mmetsp:Transcript_14066/g.26556  ORF Transcript_14066/g.26556 Transcript_14066/m.26556 type:complete len:850 (-) Transcript_14066:2211-4760(-)
MDHSEEERSVGSGSAGEPPGAERTLTPVSADEGSDWRYRDSAVDIEAPSLDHQSAQLSPQSVDGPVDGSYDSSEDSRSHEESDAPYLLGAPGRTPHPSSSHRKRHLVPWGEGPLKKSASSGSSSDMGFETSSTESETEGSETSSPTMDRPCVLTIVASDEECVELQETMSAGTASTAVEHPAATQSIVAACATPPRRAHRSGGAGGTVRRRTGSISSDGSSSGGGFMPSPPSSTLKVRRERLVRTPPPAACTLGAIRTGSSFGSALPPLEGSFAQSSSRSSTPSQSSSLSSSLSSSTRGRRGRQHPLSYVQSPRAPSPQTPQSCPEYFDCDSPDDSQDDSRHEGDSNLLHRRLRSEDISNAMIQSPDLYVYCTDEGAARECRYEDETEANDQVSIDLEPPLDGRNLPRRRIHWAASPRHHHRSQHRRSTIGKHRRKQQHHHRSSPLPSDAVVASHQSSSSLSTFLTTPLVMTPGTLLRLFLSASLAAFVLAQSYALAVHRVWGSGGGAIVGGGSFASPWADAPGFGTHFGMPLGGDGPLGKYGARGLGEALEEERLSILGEIGDALTRTSSSSMVTAARASGDKFDVRLVPKSGRSDLLRTSAEALKLCPSVGDVRVQEQQDGGNGADDDAKAGIAAANGDGPPPRESPSGGGGGPAAIARGADAVLVLADDIAFTCEELDRAFAVWSSDPRRAVGFFPRRGGGSASSSSRGEGSSSAYAALSDRAIFVHRSVYGSLARRVASSSSSSSSSNGGGSERDRCQDLALSVAASYVSSEAPLAVKSRPLRLVEDENSVSSFEEEEGGDEDTTALCLSRLASSLGMKAEDLPTEERVYLGGGGGGGATVTSTR